MSEHVFSAPNVHIGGTNSPYAPPRRLVAKCTWQACRAFLDDDGVVRLLNEVAEAPELCGRPSSSGEGSPEDELPPARWQRKRYGSGWNWALGCPPHYTA